MPDKIFLIKNYSIDFLENRIKKLTESISCGDIAAGRRPYLKGTLGSGHNDNINMQILKSKLCKREAQEQRLEFYEFLLNIKGLNLMDYWAGKKYYAKARLF